MSKKCITGVSQFTTEKKCIWDMIDIIKPLKNLYRFKLICVTLE